MPRSSRLRAFRHFAVYKALTLASRAGRAMSLTRARRVGRSLGRLAYRVLPRERAKALRHLAIAFPDQTAEQHQATVRAMFEHLGTALLEICWLPNINRDNLSQYIRFEGFDHLDRAMKNPSGVVVFTAHCGNWEWLATAVGLSFENVNVVARDIHNERLNDFVVQSRARHGVKSIGRGSDNAARDILRTLKSGGLLALLIDQSIRAENVDVTFFGRPAPTPVGAAKMAIRAGAMAIAGFIERLPDGMHVVRFDAPVETSRDDDPVELTQRMTSAIEQQIRRVPEQWVWMHERWKRR